MKKALLLIPLLALMLVAPAFAKPASLTTSFNQAQFQWRGVSAFGDWTLGYSYQNSPETSDYKVTGNVLHTSWSYSPLVTGLQGQSTVYVYDKSAQVWVEKEGQVKYVYVPGYGAAQVVNFFRGYLDFGGKAPSDVNFVHGVAYQWAYLYLPSTATLSGSYTANAIWDAKVGAWLVGFSIYLWDKAPQAYTTPFPDPFPEPIPANNFNPLGL